MQSECTIGVLMLDLPEVKGESDLPIWRIPGTLGSDETVDFALMREVVPDATSEKVMRGDIKLVQHFVMAAKKLEQQGVRGIVGDCGFMASYQQEVSRAVSCPVALSTLILVPLVHTMLRPNQKVGILSVDSRMLTQKHFDSVGWSANNIPIVIAGVEDVESWAARTEKRLSDSSRMGMDLVQLTIDFTSMHSDVGAIVVECTLMAPYTRAIRRAVRLPIFDVITLTRLIFEAM